MSRFGNTRDHNEAEIVLALIADGNAVQRMGGGEGEPDLLVWARRLRCFVLIEVKNPEGRQRGGQGGQQGKPRLTPKQVTWHASWANTGAPIFIVDTVDRALACVRVGDQPTTPEPTS